MLAQTVVLAQTVALDAYLRGAAVEEAPHKMILELRTLNWVVDSNILNILNICDAG